MVGRHIKGHTTTQCQIILKELYKGREENVVNNSHEMKLSFCYKLRIIANKIALIKVV